MVKNKISELAEKIRELRTIHGLTQEQFAAKVGVTFSTVNRWESGRSKPSPLALKQIETFRGNMKNQSSDRWEKLNDVPD